MLARRVFLNHVFCGALVELGVYSEVAKADIALGAREEEYI